MANDISPLSPDESHFVARLRAHPPLFERFRSVLGLADGCEHSVGTADEVEAQLIELTRQLGRTTLESWVAHAEATVADELRREHPEAQLKKKRT